MPFSASLSTTWSGSLWLFWNRFYYTFNVLVWNAALRYNLKKRHNDLDFFPRQTIEHHSKPSLCPQPLMLKSWMVLWRPTRPFKLTSKERCPFHHRELEWKRRKSREIWSNSQVWPWSTKWSRAKANRVCQENPLVIANTLFQQHRRWFYIWISLDGQYQNQTDYILCSQRWRGSIQSAKTRPGADCGSDHELLITKFRLKLKKVGKTTRPFR